MKSFRLIGLDPMWTDVEHATWRYNVGFSFLCPRHNAHRLVVRFINPYDGFEYVDGPGILVRMVANGSFDELTVVGLSGEDAINFGMCGLLRVIDGTVELAP